MHFFTVGKVVTSTSMADGLEDMMAGFEKQEAEATKLFKEADADKSGSIEKKELTKLLGDLNIGLEDEHVSLSKWFTCLSHICHTKSDALRSTTLDLTHPMVFLPKRSSDIFYPSVQKLRRRHVQKIRR